MRKNVPKTSEPKAVPVSEKIPDEMLNNLIEGKIPPPNPVVGYLVADFNRRKESLNAIVQKIQYTKNTLETLRANEFAMRGALQKGSDDLQKILALQPKSGISRHQLEVVAPEVDAEGKPTSAEA